MCVLFFQPLSPSSQRRLKQLSDKHGSEKIYQVTGVVVGSRDLDLNLAKGELVAIISEADTRGDKRRWLVDAGGRKQPFYNENGSNGNHCSSVVPPCGLLLLLHQQFVAFRVFTGYLKVVLSTLGL